MLNMPDSKTVIIEVFVVVSILNAFLGIGQDIYSDAFPGESLRSPFSKEPLGDSIDANVPNPDLQNIQNRIAEITDGDNGPLDWISDGIANLQVVAEITTTFIKFLFGGYIVDILVDGVGFPGHFAYIFTVPLSIYTIHLLVGFITNRST